MSKILIGLDVGDEVIEDIIDGAGYSIGYWAQDGEHDVVNRSYTIVEIETGETHKVHYGDITDAISKLVNQQVSVRSDIREAIVLDLADYKNASRMDAEVYDVIIQVAALDEIVYG